MIYKLKINCIAWVMAATSALLARIIGTYAKDYSNLEAGIAMAQQAIEAMARDVYFRR